MQDCGQPGFTPAERQRFANILKECVAFCYTRYFSKFVINFKLMGYTLSMRLVRKMLEIGNLMGLFPPLLFLLLIRSLKIKMLFFFFSFNAPIGHRLNSPFFLIASACVERKLRDIRTND